jgi:hypothetical protein
VRHAEGQGGGHVPWGRPGTRGAEWPPRRPGDPAWRLRHRALLLGIALLLAIAVARGGCTSMQESAHRSADHVAGEGAVYTSGAVLPNVDGPVLSGFVAFGDSGGGPAQLPIARAIGRWVAAGHQVDALIPTGDNVYDDGDPQQQMPSSAGPTGR